MSPARNKSKVLVVLGATGTQGSAILRWFAAHCHEYALRGVTRTPESAASTGLASIGVDMIQGDLNDVASLQRAFAGATHLYVNIDSISLIFEGIHHPDRLNPDETPFQYGSRLEIGIGANVIAAAANTPTLEQVILSSLPGPTKRSNGKYTNATHFDAKEAIREMFLADKSLHPKLSTLIIGLYMDMPLRSPLLYPINKAADGTYELSLALSRDAILPFASVATDAGSWVEKLFAAPPGTTLIGSSEMLTWDHWIEKWANCNSVKGRYVLASEADHASRLFGAGRNVLDSMQFVAEYGMAGGDRDAKLPQDIGALATALQVAMYQVDWSSLLQ